MAGCGGEISIRKIRRLSSVVERPPCKRRVISSNLIGGSMVFDTIARVSNTSPWSGVQGSVRVHGAAVDTKRQPVAPPCRDSEAVKHNRL